MGKAKLGLRSAALVGVGALLLAACGGGDGDGGGTTTDGGEPQTGGTITFLNIGTQIQHLDPQRNYTGEDLSFAGSYLNRTLVSYTFVEGGEGWSIVPDMATDIGTPNDDATSWEFTLRDGITFEDGSEVTCEDVKYGISRTFAQSVITDGPQYAVSMLDVEGYLGPYDESSKNNVAGFDKAVECNDKTITFNLVRPIPDFNLATTLLSFSPVPEAADTGEKYDEHPMSTGPYMIQTYEKKNELILVPNEEWSQDSDPIRTRLPDQIVMKFSQNQKTIDERLINDQGEDQTALVYGDLDPSSLANVFNDPRFEDRRFDEFDPYVTYYAINTQKVPNVMHRQAIVAALDREAVRLAGGGDFAGTFADGLLKENFAPWYEPTGLYDPGLYGEAIPESGNPELAKQLIADSGEDMPEITYDYATSPAADKAAGVVVDSLALAGIKVKPNPIDPGQYYGIVLDPNRAGELMNSGWGPDWADPSTVIPELVTPSGGFNLSQWDDKAFNADVQDALVETDPDARQAAWAELNTRLVEQAVVAPKFNTKTQRLAGSGIGGAYIWAPYGSWSYFSLYVK